jgi:hypothetical protein
MTNFLDDTEISWKAKGLYAKLRQLGENTSQHALEKMSTDGRDSTRSAVNELLKGGYVVKTQTRDNGRVTGMNWSLPKEAAT